MTNNKCLTPTKLLLFLLIILVFDFIIHYFIKILDLEGCISMLKQLSFPQKENSHDSQEIIVRVAENPEISLRSAAATI